MHPKLTIGLAFEDTTAAAVVYPTSVQAPLFVYHDRRNHERRAHIDAYFRLPPELQAAVRRHIRVSALSYAVIRGQSLDKLEALALAAARAVEQLKHRNPAAWAVVTGRHDVQIVHTSGTPLPTHLTDSMPERVVGKRGDDWRVAAAHVLARSQL